MGLVYPAGVKRDREDGMSNEALYELTAPTLDDIETLAQDIFERLPAEFRARGGQDRVFTAWGETSHPPTACGGGPLPLSVREGFQVWICFVPAAADHP